MLKSVSNVFLSEAKISKESDSQSVTRSNEDSVEGSNN